MFSQLLKQRQHSILAISATMPVCEDKMVSESWLPEQNIGFRGYNDTNWVLGDIGV